MARIVDWALESAELLNYQDLFVKFIPKLSRPTAVACPVILRERTGFITNPTIKIYLVVPNQYLVTLSVTPRHLEKKIVPCLN